MFSLDLKVCCLVFFFVVVEGHAESEGQGESGFQLKQFCYNRTTKLVECHKCVSKQGDYMKK